VSTVVAILAEHEQSFDSLVAYGAVDIDIYLGLIIFNGVTLETLKLLSA
jgi:hypothetical protein